MNTIDDALAGVDRLSLDTAPIIYFVERNLAYVDRVREVFRRVTVGTLSAHSSVITLAEVLTLPKRLGDDALAQRYRRLLLRSRNFTLGPINATIAERAADLRARYGLRTPDALQIATGLVAGCAAFLTNDGRLRRVSELRVLVLDDLTL